MIWSAGEAGKRLLKYYDIIMEIDRRLSEAVDLKSEDFAALYEPIGKMEENDGQITPEFLANYFVLCDNRIFNCYDENESFELIRGCASKLPNKIYEMIDESGYQERVKDDHADILDVINAIRASDYSPTAKLNLIDAVMEPEVCAEKLIALLSPVITEFRKCEELYEPLLELYEETLSCFKDERELASYFWIGNFEYFKGVNIYPLIVLAEKSIMGTNKQFEAMGECFIGALAYFKRKNFTYSTRENELGMILNALSNKNRIRIIEELSEGERFGRELAEKLQVTTGSISQSINMLVSAGIVKMAGVGSRTYYSIDYDGVERFIQLLTQLFYNNRK